MDEAPATKKSVGTLLKSFPRTYWVVIVMEFFERTAFYGMMAFLADYFVEHVGSHTQWGIMRPVLFWLLYIIPLFSGAMAEKVGYKKILSVAFVLMALAYFLAGYAVTFLPFLLTMVLLGVGGGLFKPVISGTIARSTDKSNSTMGFGIYYWTINVGSLITSLVAHHFVQQESYTILFVLSGIYVSLMLVNNLFFYREPQKPGKIKSYADVFNGIKTVCLSGRFIVLLVIFSGFWIMYNRSQDSALWLLRENYLDLAPVNSFVSSVLGPLGIGSGFEFSVANVMTINAGVIVLCQVPVSYLVRNTKPVPTMVVGIGLAVLFPLILFISNNAWLFILGLVLFSIGEITAYPKLISYVGLIAPKDKVAIYMGFVFLPVAFSTFFDPINGVIWERLVIKGGDIPTYWLIIAGIGFATMVALIIYDRTLGRRPAIEAS